VESKKKTTHPNPPIKKAPAGAKKVATPVLIDPLQAMTRTASGGTPEVNEDLIDFKSRDAVIAAYMFLVQIIAANITTGGKIPPNINFDDLVSYGVAGLVKAWENFDKKKKVKFKVYASYRIRGEILDKIRKEWKYQNPGGYKSINKIERSVTQAALDTKGATGNKENEESLRTIAANSAVAYLLSYEDSHAGEIISDHSLLMDETIIDQIDFNVEKKALWQAVKDLDNDEKQIVKLFYIDSLNQKEIAEQLGYSKSKVSRMHADVLGKLRIRLQRKLNSND